MVYSSLGNVHCGPCGSVAKMRSLLYVLAGWKRHQSGCRSDIPISRSFVVPLFISWLWSAGRACQAIACSKRKARRPQWFWFFFERLRLVNTMWTAIAEPVDHFRAARDHEHLVSLTTRISVQARRRAHRISSRDRSRNSRRERQEYRPRAQAGVVCREGVHILLC